MKVEKINTFEREYKYELPLVYKEFLCKYDGLSLDNGFLQVASIMPFPVCAKEPVRYQIRLAKPALLILHPTNRMSFRLL